MHPLLRNVPKAGSRKVCGTSASPALGLGGRPGATGGLGEGGGGFFLLMLHTLKALDKYLLSA